MQPVLLITGINGNLGSALARHFVSAGYKVLGTCRPGKSAKLDLPNVVHVFEVDLADATNCKNVFAEILSLYPVIDVMLATAGGFKPGKLAQLDDQSWNEMLTINFNTALNSVMPVFYSMLKSRQGRIFLFGARAGLTPEQAKGAVAYGLSKSLIFKLVEQLNWEARNTNLVVSVIVPSTIDTIDNRKAMPDADHHKWVSTTAIAECIAFYCSPAASELREPIIKAYNES